MEYSFDNLKNKHKNIPCIIVSPGPKLKHFNFKKFKGKILCIGDSSACGVGVENIDKSLSGNLINNLKSNFKCQWKVIAKSGVNSNQLIDLLLLEKNQNL